MAVDMFIKIGDLKGEAKDKTHGEEIDVLAWSWGMSQSGSFHVGGGGGAGKCSFQDINLTKFVDSTSNALMLACATGDHIKDAVLVVRKAGKKPLEYITITMEKVMVTALSTGGSGGEETLTESVTLNFAKVKFEYVEQKTDGSGGAAKTFSFNIEENCTD